VADTDRPQPEDKQPEDRGSDAEASGNVSDFGISVPTSDDGWGRPRPDDPRYGLSKLLRRVNSLVVGAPVDDATLESATRQLEETVSVLESAAGPGRRPRVHPDTKGSPQDYFPTSPVIGFANPIAPPVELELTEDGLNGRVFFDYQYEGPPGCVHGGVIALVFDEMLGAVNISANSPGMTGTLTIRYRKPTPILTNLRLVARFMGRDGRKIRAWGGMYDGDVLTAEAEGIFIELVADRFFAKMAKLTDSGLTDSGLSDSGSADSGSTTESSSPTGS
jgi:acyl-coenzyme A thioesterase PaaI-like protein